MSFEEIFDLLLSNDTNQREVGSIALFDAIDKNLIKHFEGKWRLTYQEADDLSQMSMFKIVQKAHTVTEAKKFERWCWAVAKNQVRDYLRKVKREKEVIDFNSEKFIDESQIQNDHDASRVSSYIQNERVLSVMCGKIDVIPLLYSELRRVMM